MTDIYDLIGEQSVNPVSDRTPGVVREGLDVSGETRDVYDLLGIEAPGPEPVKVITPGKLASKPVPIQDITPPGLHEPERQMSWRQGDSASEEPSEEPSWLQGLAKGLGIDKSLGMDVPTATGKRKNILAARAVRDMAGGRTETPRKIEALASGFTKLPLLGIPQAILKARGEEQEEITPEGFGEHLLTGGGEIAGFMLGAPGGITRWATGSLLKKVPQLATTVTGTGVAGSKLIPRVAKSIASETPGLIAGFTSAAIGEALSQKDLEGSFKVLGKAAGSGAMMGATFGAAKGVIPGAAVKERIKRIAFGMTLLDAQRGTHPFDDRELSQKTVEYGMDLIFLWHGLPNGDLSIRNVDSYIKKTLPNANNIRKMWTDPKNRADILNDINTGKLKVEPKPITPTIGEAGIPGKPVTPVRPMPGEPIKASGFKQEPQLPAGQTFEMRPRPEEVTDIYDLMRGKDQPPALPFPEYRGEEFTFDITPKDLSRQETVYGPSDYEVIDRMKERGEITPEEVVDMTTKRTPSGEVFTPREELDTTVRDIPHAESLELPEWAKKERVLKETIKSEGPERSIIDQAAEKKIISEVTKTKEETTDVTSETKPEGWQSVVKDSKGKNYVGEPGETHAQIIQRNGLDWGTETGFLDENGKYLRQTESPAVTKLLTKPVQQRVPAIKIDGKIYTSNGESHNMVWNDIPAGAIATSKTPIESGWAYGDGSEFGKKKIDLRAEKLTAKFLTVSKEQTVTDINGKEVRISPDEPYYRIERNEDGTVTLIDGKEITTTLKELGSIVGTFSKEPNLSAGGLTPEMRNKREKLGSKEPNPVTAYHGTSKDFTEFSKDFVGENQQSDWGEGISFSDKKYIAESFAEEAGGSRIVEVQLDLKNPARNKDLLDKNIQDALDDDMGFKSVGDVLQEKGFDGIEYTHEDGSKEYVVYDTSKIKIKPTEQKSVLGTSKTPGSYTLYSGFDPITAAKAVRDLAGEIKKAIPKLENLGKSLYESGTKDFSTWYSKMKELLGDKWKVFQSHVNEIWDRLIEPLKNEHGAIYLGNQRLIRRSEKAKLETQSRQLRRILDKVTEELDTLSGPDGKQKFIDLKNERIQKFFKAIEKLKTDPAAYRRQGYQRAIELLKKKEYTAHVNKLKSTKLRLEKGINKLSTKSNKTSDINDILAPEVTKEEQAFIKSMPDMDYTDRAAIHQNPVFTFESWGNKKGKESVDQIKEMFYWNIREATHKSDLHFSKIHEKMEEYKKGLSNKASKRIYTYALAQERGGKEILDKMGIKEIPTLTAKEVEAYAWMRRGYESMYTLVNRARLASGLEQFRKVENYFTFARDVSLAERIGFGMNDRALNETYIHPKGTPFKYAKSRTGGIRKVQMDAFSVFDQYMQSATRHMHMSPEIAKSRERARFLEKSQPNAFAVITPYLDYTANGKKITFSPEIDNAIRQLTKNITFATLSGMVRSALIQPSALNNAYTEIGSKYLYEGLKGLATQERIDAYKNSDVLLNREFDLNASQTFEGTFGKLSNIRDRYNKSWLGMKLLKFLDMETATATRIGAYKKGISEGMTPQQAKHYADDLVIKTQASAAKHDIAPLQRMITGQFFTTFQSFVIGNFNWLARDVVGIKNPTIKNSDQFRKVFRFILGTTLINAFYEDFIGVKSPLPTPIRSAMETYNKNESLTETAISAGLEFTQLMPGLGNIRYGSSILGASPEFLSDVSKKLANTSGTYVGYTKSWPELIGKAAGVPGTAQVAKSLRIIDKGGSYTDALLGRYPEKDEDEVDETE
jgi:hypothetical protein